MPVVTRADCTQTNVQETYKFVKADSSYTPTIRKVKLRYQSCQGANNQDNDLGAFVQQLVNDGKLSTDEQDIFNQRVVGKNKCSAATTNFLEDKGYERDHVVDTAKWTFIVGEGYDGEKPILDYRIFHEMIEAQEVPIVRRVCPSCSEMTHRDIYYRRLTPIPDDFNLLDTLMNNWFDENNVLGVDFALYSSHLDAYLDTNRWTFCNYNDPNIGFPRDCGPTRKINNQWNSYYRSGGTANHHAFMVPADPSFQSKLVHDLYPRMEGNAFALRKGLRVSGTTLTHWYQDNYATYASVNFGEPGATKGIKINYSKGNDGGKMEIRLGGPTGTIIAEFSPPHTGNWGTYNTAYIGLPDASVTGVHDLTFVAKDVRGVLDFAYFELSDFADRTAVHARIEASEISTSKGVRMVAGAKKLGNFDDGDFVTYSQVNFGTPGTTEGIILRYAKQTNGGSMEVRLGGPAGSLLAEFKPINTGSWSGYVNAYVGIEGVDGIHDLTFVGTGISGVLDLEYFQLDARNELHPIVSATAFSTHSGMRMANQEYINHMYDGDFITYDSLNFGSSGDTNSIKITYSKGNDNGYVELRLGGPEGQLIGNFSPQRTGGWHDFVTIDVLLDPVVGTHDLTIVTKDNKGVMDFKSFELSEEIFFEITTDYAVNSDPAASSDIQCTFEVVKMAFIDNIYDRYYVESAKTPDEVFWEHLNVNNDESAMSVVKSLCETAQANMEEM